MTLAERAEKMGNGPGVWYSPESVDAIEENLREVVKECAAFIRSFDGGSRHWSLPMDDYQIPEFIAKAMEEEMLPCTS